VIIVTLEVTRTATGHAYLHHKYLYLQRMITAAKSTHSYPDLTLGF
jgi:hypothetical protein